MVKKLFRFLLIFLLLLVIILIYGRFGGTRGLYTYEYRVDTKMIPESFDGLKIVHFSDLHYLRIMGSEELREIIKEINLINPDIVFFTGDLIDMDFDLDEQGKEEMIDLLKSIHSKYGKYAIRGNHDYVKDEDMISDIWKRSDFTLLLNDYDVIFSDSNDKIFVGGADTYSYDMADIDKVMEYFKDNEDISYKIILVHEPDYADVINEKYQVNLILAGHSHGGQVNIPYIKNLFLPYGSRKYYDKFYALGDTSLYISSGIGVSKINFRLFNKPSINFYRINKITD